jgi:hypothetical protein
VILAAAWGTSWWREHALPTLAVHGATLTATDALGRSLFKRTFDMPVQSVCAGRFGPGGSAAVACVLSWDGTEEGPNALDSGQRWGNRVYFLNLRGTVLALSRLNQESIAGGFAPRFQTEMQTHQFAKGEPERLVLYRHHALWYPAGLNIYQPLQRNEGEGRLASPVVDSLHSSGHLVRPFAFEDLDGDGRDEIAFTCVNNRLYRVYAVGAMHVSPLGAAAGTGAMSPDRVQGVEPPLTIYRLVSFDHAYPTLGWRASPPTLVVSDQGIPFLELGPRGESRDGPGPSPEQVRALNDWITDLCRLRDMSDWDAMLSSLRSDGQALPPPYDWLHRFFTTHALIGLGRYDEALATLSAGPTLSDGRQPFMSYRMRLEALFLAGRYRECLLAFVAMKEESRTGWSDLAYPVFWAAVYAGDDPLVRALEPGKPVNPYPVPEAPSLLAALQGDYRRAELLARAEHPETSLFPGPALALAHVLVAGGKVAEARALLDSVNRRFPGEDPDGGETDLWVMWHEQPGSQGLLASMDRVVAQKRRRAKAEVEVRALLPLTLARAARMHRDAGDLAAARALQEEACHLAPKSWRVGLSL